MPKTLVIGASEDRMRYANMAVHTLIRKDQEVVAIGKKEGMIYGIEIQKGYPPLTDIHTVTLYLNPMNQQKYYDYIISLNPKRVIFNPGTENPEFYELLHQNNIEFEEACTLVLLNTNNY